MQNNLEWCVGEGRASWHQQRAGHFYAASTVGFATREEAEAFVAKLKLHHPEMVVGIYSRPKDR